MGRWPGLGYSAALGLTSKLGHYQKLGAPEGTPNGVILDAQGLIPRGRLAGRGQGRACRGLFPVERRTQYLIEGAQQHGSSDFRSGMEG